MKWFSGSKKKAPIDDIAMQLAMADRISRRVIQTSNSRDVATGAISDLKAYMSADWAILVLLDKPAGEASRMVLVGDGGSSEADNISFAGTPFAWVAEKKQALFQPDCRQDGLYTLDIFGESIRSVVHMPLIYQGRVFGVLSIGSNQLNAYNESQLRLLRHMVTHLAISLKNTLMMEHNVRTEAMLSNLDELLTIITSSQDLPEVFPEFAERLRKITDFDCLSLGIVEGKILRVLISTAGEDSYPKYGEILPINKSAIPWMEEHREISVAGDLELQRQFPVDDILLEKGYRAAVRLPLFSHGQLIASLDLLSCQPDNHKDELAFLKELPRYMATPVQSYLLYIYEKQRVDWLSALAHYLKTPLTPITSSSQLLSEELNKVDGGMLGKLAKNIFSGADNLSKNLKLFWDLSDVESARFSLEIEKGDIKQLLGIIADEVQAGVDAKSQILELKLPETLPESPIDSKRIMQVLKTLVDNAVEVSPEGGRIELRARVEDEEIIIEVVDSGKTLSLEDRESLLRPYYLTDADLRAFQQLTIKLATCRRLVELHGGMLQIESMPGEGNIFSFTIPLEE